MIAMIATIPRPETVMPSRTPQTHALTGTATGTSNATGKLGPELWTEWFPDTAEGEQGTIDDLLAFLARLDTPDVTADTIRYWQKAGVLPSPVKRWHDGATRAIYPTTYAALVIRELLELKDLGYTLQQIAPRLRAHAAGMQSTDPLGIREAITDVARAYEAISKRTVTGVQIRFIDVDGRDQTYHYDIGGAGPDGSDDNQR